MKLTPFLLVALATFGCGPDKDAPPTTTPTDAPAPSSDDGAGLPPDVQTAERPATTAEQCEADGGTVVGDIGDGAIHRPEYRCENGEEPTGRIEQGVEGSVCCPG